MKACTLIVGLLALGCASGPARSAPLPPAVTAGTVASGPAPAGDDERDRLRAEAEALWRRRDEPGSVADAVARWERLAQSTETQVDSLLRLAEAHHLLGATLPRDQALPAFERGRAAAQAALDRVEETSAVRLRAAYWVLANRAAVVTRGPYLEYVDSYQGLLNEAGDLVRRGSRDDHGGAERILAALLASPPLYRLRQLEQARSHYEAVLKHHAGHLHNHVAYARHYAVAAQDFALFEQELRRVLTQAPTSPDDELARQAADRLLRLAPHLFE